MIKELKNLIYILVIFFFCLFIGKYYFSDNYKKKSYRAISLLENNFDTNNIDLLILKSDTGNIVEHVTNTPKKKKKYNFWELLKTN